MSWLQNLYETYEQNHLQIGKIEKKYNGQEFTLLPISHTTQNAHIEVSITEEGCFHSAKVIDKGDASTLIPCTEASASRAGKVNSPYPLHDNLGYVAGDFVVYTGNNEKKDHYSNYINRLKSWAESSYTVDKVNSIYLYLSKGTLIRDLVKDGILALDSSNYLIKKWDEKKYGDLYNTKPSIFNALNGEQDSAFVRFNVHSPHQSQTEVWKDKKVYDSFVSFYNTQLGDSGFCYVAGSILPTTDKHANKIRHAADKAKLISANDSSGFTYRGRFSEGKQAASISYEVSQKAHNALKWLINRQGKSVDGRIFLIWSNNNLDVPDPLDDIFCSENDSVEAVTFTNEKIAQEVKKAFAGYKNSLEDHKNEKVNVLVLDSATTGRMAVLYYRNLDKIYYFDRLEEWHKTCVWRHRYHKNDDGKYVEYHGAPATKEIALAAYGSNANDKLIKGLMERMLPCILDGRSIPRDIVSNAFQRASNPVSMENWEWERTLSITCALINKNEKERYEVALDNDNNNRDYLFGRLLAIADVLERRALGSEETRTTNAVRYMNAFSMHPERTWLTIQRSIQPYIAKLGVKATYLTKIMDEVGSRICVEDFNNKPLSGKYLLGFYSQRHDLYQKRDKEDE